MLAIYPQGYLARRDCSEYHVADATTSDGLTGPREHLPPPPRADHPRRPDAAQPRGDGVDAHRSRGQAVGPAQAHGVRRRARPRGRRADHHRRLRTHQARLAQALRGRDDHAAAGDAAPRPHRRGARRGRRDRDAGAARRALRLPPVQRQRLGEEVADHALPPERAVDQGRRPDGDGLRPLGGARSQGGLRRGRDHGLGGLPGQPVPGRAHQRPHRRVGRHRREADALRGRGRAPLARAGARGLPDRLPDLAARPGRGRPDLGRGGRAGPPARGRRRHGPEHRHRLARGAGADDHHPGPAAARGAR